ncbi:MAG: peptide ABC transporter permease [Acidobacteria bacterium]|nr:MAG: peptide ABC transporter permease [Acidobacteriota bacterium]
MIRLYSFILIFLILCSILAPILAPISFSEIHLKDRLQPPSSSHLLGTDEMGRDIFSRLLYGGRISFLISLCVVCLSVIIGVTSGSISGYFGGWSDECFMRIADIFLSFPGILLAIGIVAVLGPALNNVILALVLIGWVSYARLSRGLVLKFREFEFVTALHSLGASWPRILFRHILPNVVPAILVQASFGFAGTILAESALSFLGLGVQPPQPSWGNMLNDGKNHLLDAPIMAVFPGMAIFVTVLVLNLLGDALRDRVQHL